LSWIFFRWVQRNVLWISVDHSCLVVVITHSRSSPLNKTALKPKVRDHYHSHRLSYWNNLIPKLHVSGSLFAPSSPSGIENHLLTDHDDSDSYEGVVRDSSIQRLRSLLDSTLRTDTHSSIKDLSVESNLGINDNMTSYSRKESITSSTKIPSITPSSSSPDQQSLQKSLSASNPLSSNSLSAGHQNDPSFPGHQTTRSVLNTSIASPDTSTHFTLFVVVTVFLFVINVILFLRLHRRSRIDQPSSNNSSDNKKKKHTDNVIMSRGSSYNREGNSLSILQVKLLLIRLQHLDVELQKWCSDFHSNMFEVFLWEYSQ
jgi:hypothetical protein